MKLKMDQKCTIAKEELEELGRDIVSLKHDCESVIRDYEVTLWYPDFFTLFQAAIEDTTLSWAELEKMRFRFKRDVVPMTQDSAKIVSAHLAFVRYHNMVMKMLVSQSRFLPLPVFIGWVSMLNSSIPIPDWSKSRSVDRSMFRQIL